MPIKIPNNSQWVSSGLSDNLGSLWSSWNLDLTAKPGKTLISPRAIINTNGITDLDTVAAFQTFSDVNGGVQYYWAVAGKFVWRSVVTNGYITAFAKDASTGTPSGSNAANSLNSDVSDLVYYGKTYMVVSGNTALYCYTASTGQWSNPTSSPNLASGGVHMLCVYEGRFYVVDNRTQVRSMDTSFGVPTTSAPNFIDLATNGDANTTITFLRKASDGIWLGTLNQSERGCFMYKWDGIVATLPSNTRFIIPDASGVLACVIKNDVPWVMDNNGRLLYFNGGTFQEVQTPSGIKNGRLPIRNTKFLKNSLSATNDRWIHPNGMTIVDGRINILIDNEYEDNGATIEENIPSGVWEYDPVIGWYHKMSLGLYVSSITDYGQNRVSRVGALYEAKTASTTASANGTMLIGAKILTDATTIVANIYTNDSNDTLQKYGYLVTPKIYSPSVSETWQLLYPRFKRFLTATDSMVVKCRVTEQAPTEATITWTSSSTFTTTTDVSAMTGYEVEVLQGKGSGKCAHILSVTGSGTYTVTLDDTFTGATSGTAKARFQNWLKIKTFTGQTADWAEVGVHQKTEWVQLKLCFQFTGRNEFSDMILANTAHIKTI